MEIRANLSHSIFGASSFLHVIHSNLTEGRPTTAGTNVGEAELRIAEEL